MADPHPNYVDLADSSLHDDDDEASEEPSVIEDDYQEEEEQLPDPQIEPNYAIYLSTIGPPTSPSKPNRITNGIRRAASGEGSGLMKRRRGSQWNSNEIDGLFCPICIEAWTSDGDHCTCCGHIFGMSCIRKWLGKCHRQMCPQCNARCKLKDIRKLFALRVISVDEESQKRIRSLEAKCASHEKEQAEWHKREAKLLKEQGVLEQKNQQLMEGIHLALTSVDKHLLAASN